jgi:hypothetical protein
MLFFAKKMRSLNFASIAKGSQSLRYGLDWFHWKARGAHVSRAVGGPSEKWGPGKTGGLGPGPIAGYGPEQ